MAEETNLDIHEHEITFPEWDNFPTDRKRAKQRKKLRKIVQTMEKLGEAF